MRYFNIDTISFTDANGRTVPIKDTRPISDDQINFEIPIVKGTLLDEVASREEVFGTGSEDQSFRIFDANIAAIFDAQFNLDNVRRLKIPV